MDIEYDMMRSARDRQFLYIRNFSPELPYAGHIIYRNQSAIMQEWFRLQAERALDRRGRAVDANPADRPRSCTTRRRIRTRSATCQTTLAHQADARADAQSGDRLDGTHRRSGSHQRAGDDSADVARRRAAGNGAAVHRVAPNAGCSLAAGLDDELKAPTEVVIYVPTQGASIGYTTEEGPSAKWRLYTGPILVDRPMTLRAKAIRYGYKESAEAKTTFTKE